MKRVEFLTKSQIPFYKIDLRNREKVTKVFERHSIEGVIHFAGLKSVNESIENPLYYYDNNISSVFVLIEIMKKFDCKTFVFSSSATVYGDPQMVPIKEDFPLFCLNPYGRSKIVIEGFLKDLILSDNSWRIAILRYFNPVGADESGLIGEDPLNIPNNIMPYISQVAIGRLKKLQIFGGDYKTPDGTGIRDYIHVVDLSKGHIKALDYLNREQTLLVANLGTGRGYSVLDVVKTFESVSGKKIPYEIIDRRPGDAAISYADSSYAEEKLNWKAKYNLSKMCKDSWFWQTKNPSGYN